MLDIRLFRENPGVIKENMKKRSLPTKDVDKVIEYDGKWKEHLQKADKLKQKRNEVTREIAELKKKGKDASSKIKAMQEINKEIEKNDAKAGEFLKKREDIRLVVPNILHESVPAGKDDSDNVPIRTWGKPTKLTFKPKSHVDLLESLYVGDIERAARVAGSRFYYLKNDLVMLDLALQKFTLDFLQKKSFILFEPPLMLRKRAIGGAVDLADFENVLYKIEGEDLYLIATSEHSLAALHMDETLQEKDLPLKYAGVSACFRKEAGAHGKDTKGIFRVHQFNKVEQFVFCKPEDSWRIHEELIKNAEELYQLLGIPYRIVNICTGDIGGTAAKKYDLETWMPAQDTYREVVSCSNCTDYQARKLNIKFVRDKTGEREYVHTLNSTAIATGRTMVAILENFQQEDGSVKLPDVLVPYMNGQKKIKTER